MNPLSSKGRTRQNGVTGRAALARWVPLVDWLPRYRREQLPGDLIAGAAVAVLLVPQSMAYAVLAGLPPQVGLYASIVPVIIYAIMGTSRTLTVGPTAIAALLTAAAVGTVATQGTDEYLSVALTLTLMVGAIRIVLGVARAGFVVNFISRPVLSGFVNAAAVIIATSQIALLLGLDVNGSSRFADQAIELGQRLGSINTWTAILGLTSLAVLYYFRRYAHRHMVRLGIRSEAANLAARTGPLVVTALATAVVWLLNLNAGAGVEIVGTVPQGVPPITMPGLEGDRLITLLPLAVIISLVGFMEGISVAKALASRDRERIDANQELIAIGVSNVGSAFTGGMPVSGSPSRSMLNYTAGAETGMASIATAIVVILAVLFLTPLFYFLPMAAIAAIVIISVTSLLEASTLRRVWSYRRADAATLVITFVAVLAIGIEIGILVGIGSSILLYLWRTSHPSIVELGRVIGAEIYRNVDNYATEVNPRILLLRVDESLYFANTQELQDVVAAKIGDRPEVEHLVLVGTAINDVDASAVETLESLATQLRSAGVTMHLAGFKLTVLNQLRSTYLLQVIGSERNHTTVQQAVDAIESGRMDRPDSADLADSRAED